MLSSFCRSHTNCEIKQKGNLFCKFHGSICKFHGSSSCSTTSSRLMSNQYGPTSAVARTAILGLSLMIHNMPFSITFLLSAQSILEHLSFPTTLYRPTDCGNSRSPQGKPPPLPRSQRGWESSHTTNCESSQSSVPCIHLGSQQQLLAWQYQPNTRPSSRHL
jgi:hypothetical protein